jgi:hypothetical protein
MSENSSVVSNIITLFAVALGWFLGEATGLIRRHREIVKLKRALIIELKDCLGWLLRNKTTIEYNIRLAVLGQLPDSSPVKIPTHIYEKHFTDITVHLSNSERISFNSIYNLIAFCQYQTEQLVILRTACINDKQRLREFDSILEGMYHNLCLAIYLINYHLQSGKKLDVSKMSDEEQKIMLEKSNDDLQKIIMEAKSLGIKEVKEKYHYK